MFSSSLLSFITLITITCAQSLNDRSKFTWTQYALNSLKSRDRTASRIVGGSLANAMQGPFMVELATMISGIHVCGGSLISSRTVITAAHCCLSEASKGELLIVRFDGLNRHHFKQTRDIIEIIRHPEFTYFDDPPDFDYCLLHLDSEVIPSETVKFIRIADEMPSPGEKAMALGWGYTHSDSGSARHLKQANFTIIDQTNCTFKYETPFTERYICITEPGNSICSGDSGGPLIYNKKLLGIASFLNFHDCDPGKLQIFANALVVKEWIEKNKI